MKGQGEWRKERALERTAGVGNEQSTSTQDKIRYTDIDWCIGEGGGKNN